MSDQISAAPRRGLPNHLAWLGAVACVALAGCAAPPAIPEALSIAPEPGHAVVIGWGNTALEKARAALITTQGARVSSLFVAKVNEQKSKFGENITRLVSGDYALTIACELYVDYRIFPQDKVIQASLRAGRVYRLRAEPEGRRCQPEIEDVTDREK